MEARPYGVGCDAHIAPHPTDRRWNMANRLTIDEGYCKGCLVCATACPKNILELDLSKVNAKGYNPIKCTDIDKCIACAMCARICPDSVIKVEKDV